MSMAKINLISRPRSCCYNVKRKKKEIKKKQ